MWYVDGKINGILQNWLDVWIQGVASFLHQGMTESGDLTKMIIRSRPFRFPPAFWNTMRTTEPQSFHPFHIFQTIIIQLGSQH